MRPSQIPIRLIIFALLGTSLVSLTFAADDTPKREGDPSIAAAILAKTREVKPDGQAHLLTKTNLTAMPDAYGSDVHLSTVKGAPVRLVLSAWTPQGVFAQEYYLDNNRLIFVYETLSLFTGEPSTGWKNFMGYGGWERRVYLVNGAIGFTETFGEGAPPADAPKLKATLGKLVEAVCRENAKSGFQCL